MGGKEVTKNIQRVNCESITCHRPVCIVLKNFACFHHSVKKNIKNTFHSLKLIKTNLSRITTSLVTSLCRLTAAAALVVLRFALHLHGNLLNDRILCL